MVELGALLFHDRRLSADDSLSCASCHEIAAGGDDGKPRSVGIGGQLGGINAPTVLNSALNIAQFWDGRAKTLEEQIDGPLTATNELGSTWPDVLGKLSKDVALVGRFDAVFVDGMTATNVRRAIATFERSLVTVDSPFDRWLRGDEGALPADALRGYELFKEHGCISCHQGRNVGGNMYQTFGVMGDYFADRGDLTDADLGRFAVTGRPEDKHRFRVPPLRNVALTAPYFHDGSAATLPDAVRVMARYQLGRRVADEDVTYIVAFLRSLTGELPSVEPHHL
ncbi:MAG: cytochrome-c peroxidase [Myxococcales bacterium]|nr:cytochrome-c peroxidase [Myxococcales bacterium]